MLKYAKDLVPVTIKPNTKGTLLTGNYWLACVNEVTSGIEEVYYYTIILLNFFSMPPSKNKKGDKYCHCFHLSSRLSKLSLSQPH